MGRLDNRDWAVAWRPESATRFVGENERVAIGLDESSVLDVYGEGLVMLGEAL